MFYWQPGKWIQYAGLVVLPFAGASFLTTDSMKTDISKNAMMAAGGDWAKVALDGRDATILGTAPDDAAKAAAIAGVSGAFGVRVVKSDGVMVAPPAPPPVAEAPKAAETPVAEAPKAETPKVEVPKIEPLAAPTVTAATADANGAQITGTWPEGKAKTLDVIVSDANSSLDYSLGKSPELTSTDGNWLLKLGAGALAAGSYAVGAKVGDGDSQSVSALADKLPQLVVPAAEVPKPEPLVAPTVTDTKTDDKGSVITGTWPEGKATSLDVVVDNQDYKLGDAKELTSDKGVWTLALPPLAAGEHSIVAMEGDGTQTVGMDAPSTVEVVAAIPPPPPAAVVAPPPPPPPPAPPPAAATADNVAATVDRPTVTGTWPAGNGNTYQLELDGVTHTLGKDTDLLTGTDGKWTLTPAKPLVNGTYDVIMKVTGADGQTTTSVAKGAVVINVAPPAPAPPPEKPYDCGAALATTAAAYPVRFEFDHDDLVGDYPANVSHYADILNDPRCKAIHMQVTGHADNIGSDAYNLALSVRRASTVAALLGKDGVDGSRISTLGVGKTKPLDPANTKDARAKNRRAEFNAQ